MNKLEIYCGMISPIPSHEFLSREQKNVLLVACWCNNYCVIDSLIAG